MPRMRDARTPTCNGVAMSPPSIVADIAGHRPGRIAYSALPSSRRRTQTNARPRGELHGSRAGTCIQSDHRCPIFRPLASERLVTHPHHRTADSPGKQRHRDRLATPPQAHKSRLINPSSQTQVRKPKFANPDGRTHVSAAIVFSKKACSATARQPPRPDPSAEPPTRPPSPSRDPL